MPQPQLNSALSRARRKVLLTFDIAVRLRATGQRIPPVTDRYTPIDWVGAGGNAADALNPDNYVISRPAGGNLDGPAEAIDLTVIACEEPESGVTIVGGFYCATQVILYFDFEQTARADYRVHVDNVLDSTGAFVINPANDEADWIGHVISHKTRNFRLYDFLPKIARRMDEEGTGDLELFCRAFHEVFDRCVEDIDAFFNECCSIDYIREEWLDALLYDLGDQFSEIFTLTVNEKRRLAGTLVSLYRLKGTCVGIIEAIEYFLGITMVGCRNGWDDCWQLGHGVYPTSSDGDYLAKGVYPAQTGGDTYLGPGTSAEIWSFWLLHSTPGALTADQLTKIEALVNIWKEAPAHYLGVTTP